MKKQIRHIQRTAKGGYFLVECAICLATMSAVVYAFFMAMTAANQRTALASHVTAANALLDNYAELFRSATPDRRTNIGAPLVTMPNIIFTIPTTAGTWSSNNSTFTSPINGQAIPVTARFMWTAPTTETGNMATSFMRTTYTLQLEIPTPTVPGMTTSSANAATPMRFERSITKVF